MIYKSFLLSAKLSLCGSSRARVSSLKNFVVVVIVALISLIWSFFIFFLYQNCCRWDIFLRLTNKFLINSLLIFFMGITDSYNWRDFSLCLSFLKVFLLFLLMKILLHIISQKRETSSYLKANLYRSHSTAVCLKGAVKTLMIYGIKFNA